MIVAKVYLYTKHLVQVVPILEPWRSLSQSKGHMIMIQIHFIYTRTFKIVAMTLNGLNYRNTLNYPMYDSNFTTFPCLQNGRVENLSGWKLFFVSTTIPSEINLSVFGNFDTTRDLLYNTYAGAHAIRCKGKHQHIQQHCQRGSGHANSFS